MSTRPRAAHFVARVRENTSARTNLSERLRTANDKGERVLFIPSQGATTAAVTKQLNDLLRQVLSVEIVRYDETVDIEELRTKFFDSLLEQASARYQADSLRVNDVLLMGTTGGDVEFGLTPVESEMSQSDTSQAVKEEGKQTPDGRYEAEKTTDTNDSTRVGRRSELTLPAINLSELLESALSHSSTLQYVETTAHFKSQQVELVFGATELPSRLPKVFGTYLIERKDQ